ncbi:MAG: CCA tRNA nucleotidyltransferase, partial [Candidatus Adiutrix sp.]
VRDLIMRTPSHDIDLTMDGDMDQFIAKISKTKKLVKIIKHPRFKTATIFTSDGYAIDLSTTRREYYEHPGALPVVQNGSLRMDLYRRDFTINSLAISLNSANFGELMDFYRGYQDIKDGFVRVLHNLSFVEDPTRTFRAVRFETRLGFKMSKMTAGFLEGAVRNNFLTSIDRRRLLHELKLILSEDDPSLAIKRLDDFKLLPYIHPKIALRSDSFELFTKVRRMRDWLVLTFPEKTNLAWLVYLLALTAGLKPQVLGELSQSLGLKKKESSILLQERSQADNILADYKGKKHVLKPSEAYSLFSDLSWPTIIFIMAKTSNEELSKAGVLFLTAYRLVRPLCSGRDIMAAGVPHGPKVKEMAEKLRLARLDGVVKTREDELKLIGESLR